MCYVRNSLALRDVHIDMPGKLGQFSHCWDFFFTQSGVQWNHLLNDWCLYSSGTMGITILDRSSLICLQHCDQSVKGINQTILRLYSKSYTSVKTKVLTVPTNHAPCDLYLSSTFICYLTPSLLLSLHSPVAFLNLPGTLLWQDFCACSSIWLSHLLQNLCSLIIIPVEIFSYKSS